LDSDEGHHAVRVRRVRVGESVELVDGRGTRAEGVVTVVGKSECTVEVRAVAHELALVPRLTVVQALVKRDRSDQTMELLTEAGVDMVVPWSAARSQSSEVPAKWPRIAAESSKQSRRARFPVITPAGDTAAVRQLVTDTVASGGVVLLCHENAHSPIADVLRDAGALSDSFMIHGTGFSAASDLDGGSGALTGSDAPTSPSELDGGSGARNDVEIESPAIVNNSAETTDAHTAVAVEDIVVVVGPEGGLTADELAAFTAAGAKPVVMGPSVMRAATAGAAAACIVSALTNRWRGRSPQ
ncbi:MAG: RsmE family RNA methyltransferase, partial [Actinomycetales bacterium]|nr:RsmE family RNA methyltransferase [Actinomycetales bacterium]